jgi:hypothetical protein
VAQGILKCAQKTWLRNPANDGGMGLAKAGVVRHNGSGIEIAGKRSLDTQLRVGIR